MEFYALRKRMVYVPTMLEGAAVPKGRDEGHRGHLVLLHVLLYALRVLVNCKDCLHYEEGTQRGRVRGVGVVIRDLPSVPAVPNFRNAHAKIRERPPDERVQSPPDGYE